MCLCQKKNAVVFKKRKNMRKFARGLYPYKF